MMAIKMAIALMVAMTATPMTDEAPQRIVPLKEPVAVETEAVTEEGFTVYRIRGIEPPIEWQIALYKELEDRGIAWYMPYAVCQIFQESRWNRWADNGKDKGITQQKEIYWYSRAERYGVRGADIWDVYAQFHVYAAMMSGYLKATNNDIGLALSYYFYGNGQSADKYVHDVMSHMDFLEEVNR